MSDAYLLDVLDRMNGAPSLLGVSGSRKYTYIGGAFVIQSRVGKGERWAFGPSDIKRTIPDYAPRDVIAWGQMCERVDFSAYLRGVSARVL